MRTMLSGRLVMPDSPAVVVDASAIAAVLFNEPASDDVVESIGDARFPRSRLCFASEQEIKRFTLSWGLVVLIRNWIANEHQWATSGTSESWRGGDRMLWADERSKAG